ncbi:MAG: hypothetical protein GEU88_11895 [Solirubrobacterales bacterium]|nr:hypothetical protein [Solirubrobacterales bacterium]
MSPCPERYRVTGEDAIGCEALTTRPSSPAASAAGSDGAAVPSSRPPSRASVRRRKTVRSREEWSSLRRFAPRGGGNAIKPLSAEPSVTARSGSHARAPAVVLHEGTDPQTATTGETMAKSYYSTVFVQPADDVWRAVRSFDEYSWADRELSAVIEEDRSGDAVGGVRRVDTDGGTLRQRLIAHSDLDRSYTYELCDPAPFPVRDYVATLRVTPIVDGDRAFVEWWATFDCAAEDHDRWITQFEESFARWLGSLRARLEGGG